MDSALLLPIPEGFESTEVWLPIPGFPSYEISSFGAARSVVRELRYSGCYRMRPYVRIDPGRILRPTYRGYYLSVTLVSPTGERVPRALHRLVAEVFFGEPGPGQIVRHLDDDRTNNRASNLRYGTPAENGADKVRNGRILYGTAHKSSKLNPDLVRAVRELTSLGLSQRTIGARVGVCAATIRSIQLGRTWKGVGVLHPAGQP